LRCQRQQTSRRRAGFMKD